MGPIRPEIEALELSGITKVSQAARGVEGVAPLWFGESDLVTPGFIREAAKRALDEGQTFYSTPRGIPPLREALQVYHRRVYGLDLHEDRVHALGSTMLCAFTAAQCLLDPGDECVLVSPYWPNIRHICQFRGAIPVDVRLDEAPKGGWSLDLNKIESSITPRTKAVYVNSPSNPTGWVMSAGQQRELLELCRRHGLGLISDEVYHRNLYDGRTVAPSFLDLADPEDEPVFVINGFSKGWAMTGWRLGWMVAPKRLIGPMSVLAESTATGATVFAQHGAVAALEEGDGFIAEQNERCRVNRDMVMEILAAHPRVRLSEPEGAFYAFPAIDGLTDSLEFCKRLAVEGKVGTAAGYTFGEGNENNVRLCFALSTDKLRPALERMAGFLDKV